jgi:endo-1,4-beta-xylanase
MKTMASSLAGAAALMAAAAALAQTPARKAAPRPPLPAPLGLPAPGPVTDRPYAPQPILQGGVVVPLYAPGAPQLNAARVREAEVYSMSKAVPGRISSIVNIHNPSVEVHLVEGSLNTGAAVIVAAGGGHRTLNVASESADMVPFLYNYGVNTIILRNRLRNDGYDVQKDAVNDALQAVRLVRAYASEWKLDPKRIGIMGFSAGAELAAAAAVFYEAFDRGNTSPSDPFAGVTARPDFVGLVYPGPTPFARGGSPAIPRDVPPAFVATPGSGDQVHALWAVEYITAMLQVGAPNVELHVYAGGRHPGDTLPDGGRMSAGLADRNGMPFGTWQQRFVDWFRDLGFLQKPGVETRAARELATFVPRPRERAAPAATPAPAPASPTAAPAARP